MKKLVIIVLAMLLLTACGEEKEDKQGAGYMNITAQQAKELMDSQTGYVILDTRTQEEYDQGHIPGAINVPNEEIGTAEITELPDKSQLILVYCRSGRRSKEAAEKLVALGYTNIHEFGGILDWTGEIEK